MSAKMNDEERDANRCFCKPCKRFFPDWQTLMKHKATMRENGSPFHIHCKVCGSDFLTLRAEWLHMQKCHPEEQKLVCPGCGRGPFPRLAAFMEHIERGECPRIRTSTLEERREKKLEFPRMLEALTKQSVKGNYTNYFTSDPQYGSSTKHDDWSVPKEKPNVVVYNSEREYPTLTGTSSKLSAEAKEPVRKSDDPLAWSVKKNLFPNGQAGEKNITSEYIETSITSSVQDFEEDVDIDHPDHPNFNIGRYSCPYTGKFNCPKVRCGKTFKKSGGLVVHLRSPAHNAATYRCPACLRPFKSLTAITYHVENSSAKCPIRESDNFEAYLDQLTAGLVTVDRDRHTDGTIKYSTSKAAWNLFQAESENGSDESRRPMVEPGWGTDGWATGKDTGKDRIHW